MSPSADFGNVVIESGMLDLFDNLPDSLSDSLAAFQTSTEEGMTYHC